MRVFAFGIVLALSLLAGRANAAGTCGEKKTVVQQLINHGYKALAGAWPWHGAMFHRYRRSTSYACGVTILTEQFVITAAHCTIDDNEKQRIPADRVFIKVGVTNLDAPDRHVQQHNIDTIIRHEGYNEGTFEDDIALMKLYTDIEYNSYVQPICLWQGDTNLSKIVSQVGYIIGWGLNENFGLPNDLNEATVPIVSKKECIDSDPSHYSKFYFEPKTFCAGYRNGTNAAPGDSGGGMFLRVGQHWVLRGIVSTTKLIPDTLNVDANSFVVFTDASYYIDWIKSRVTITTSFEIDAAIIEPPPSSRPPGDSGSQANLLNIASCGKDTYPSGTPEEIKGYLNQYPWLAVIEYINTNTRVLEDTCHAVLIHPSFLVTVAHCVQKKRLSTIRSVRLNDYRLDTVNDIFEIDGKTTRTMATRIPVRGISVHPNYNNPKFANSIALIKLERPTTANPICLSPKLSTLPPAKKFTIIGWKKNSRKEKPLIRNVVQLADFGSCRSKYAEENISLDSTGGQVCSTYSHDDDNENCSHYMGSAPFQYVRNGPFEGRYFLAAISSFGHSNCRRYEFSDVFTNVAHYADWIQEKVKNNE
ncbi:transmembrane protease serine 9-like [Ochlerotatus camptorhynchus]|uniref:transmembrane protease serine 9-like n=1 Tax=Ochlerotatus camptorhynchus TaxID=644619 RepID=UPI0031DC9A71